MGCRAWERERERELEPGPWEREVQAQGREQACRQELVQPEALERDYSQERELEQERVQVQVQLSAPAPVALEATLLELLGLLLAPRRKVPVLVQAWRLSPGQRSGDAGADAFDRAAQVADRLAQAHQLL